MSNHSRESHQRMGALRAQLDSIIHRHARAEFHVHLVIHELSAVPYLDGDYAIKWKFRGVVNAKGLKSDPPKRKGKEREWTLPIAHADDSDRYVSGPPSPRIPSAGTSAAVLNTPLTTSPNASTISLPSSASSSGPSHAPGSSSTYSFPTTSLSMDSEPEFLHPPNTHFHSHDRGITPFKTLKDHKVTFEQVVDVILHMYIDQSSPNTPTSSTHTPKTHTHTGRKEAPPKPTSGSGTPKGKLLPSPLKLVITQNVKVDEDHARSPDNPRLGAVYLDLSEFADPSLGPVTRKFLLAESRTNAILKVSFHFVDLTNY